jgi:hypothetical protein
VDSRRRKCFPFAKSAFYDMQVKRGLGGTSDGASKSSGHRNNIHGSTHSEVGIGVVVG